MCALSDIMSHNVPLFSPVPLSFLSHTFQSFIQSLFLPIRKLEEIEKMLSDAEDKQRQIVDQSNAEVHQLTQQLQSQKSETERLKVIYRST